MTEKSSKLAYIYANDIWREAQDVRYGRLNAIWFFRHTFRILYELLSASERTTIRLNRMHRNYEKLYNKSVEDKHQLITEIERLRAENESLRVENMQLRVVNEIL
jgi:hypothetical protein